ncbi:MAG: hypothetical protein AAF798_13840 [Bacteroidota bacterium]
MNRTLFFQTTTLVCFIFLLTTCKKDVEDNSAELLVGRWEIQEASRNGRSTASLDNLYFEFYEDGSMRTNLSGATETAKYALEPPTIRQMESKMDADYTIQEITDSTLFMSTELRGYAFRFLLKKIIPEQ